jgi:hypothetical protein
VSGWSDGQARSFAKRIADKYRPAWFVLAPEIREAVVSEFVLLIVLGQDKVAIGVEEVRALRTAICARLKSHHSMATETAAAHEDEGPKEVTS